MRLAMVGAPVAWATALLLALGIQGCGSRTGLDVSPSTATPDASTAADATAPDAGTVCVSAPTPTVLVDLSDPAHSGGPFFALTGDATRLYTFEASPDGDSDYPVLSVDPCTGSTVSFGSGTWQSPIAFDDAGVVFQSYASPDEGSFLLERAAPLGGSLVNAAALGDDHVTEITLYGGIAYAVDGNFGLVTLALDGGGPQTLVPPLANGMIRVWWDGTAVDASYAYFYGSNGLEKVPRAGGPTTVLYADPVSPACGGSEPPGDSLVVADDTTVYYSGMNGIVSVGKDGTGGGPVAGGEGSQSCGPIAIDDTYIYFATSGELARIPKTGGTPTQLASSASYDVGGIVVTASTIYWLDFTNAIMKLDKP
jgi:hypothetical protein